MFGVRVRDMGQFSLNRSAGRGHCSLSEPSPNGAGRQVPYLRLHQPGSYCLPHLGNPLSFYPTQLLGPPKLFPVVFLFSGLPWLMLQMFLNSFKAAASYLSMLCAWLSGAQPALAAVVRSQLGLSWTPPHPAQVAAHCRLLCSSC